MMPRKTLQVYKSSTPLKQNLMVSTLLLLHLTPTIEDEEKKKKKEEEEEKEERLTN